MTWQRKVKKHVRELLRRCTSLCSKSCESGNAETEAVPGRTANQSRDGEGEEKAILQYEKRLTAQCRMQGWGKWSRAWYVPCQCGSEAEHVLSVLAVRGRRSRPRTLDQSRPPSGPSRP